MPESVRVLLVDDEPLVRESLRAVVAEDDSFEVVGECGDGVAAIEAIESERPDLVLLDVQMPGCDGFEVLQALDPEARPVVVFVTAFDQYAIRAFDEHAVDYVLKPFDDERVRAALQRARAWIGRQEERSAQEDSMLASVQGARKRDRFVVKAAGRTEIVRLEDVEWIESRGNYLLIHHQRGESLFRGTLASVAESLDPDRYARVHRSALVDLLRVSSVESRPGGDVDAVLNSGARVPVGRSYRADFERRCRGE